MQATLDSKKYPDILLAIDVGNSNIVFACVDVASGEIICKFRLQSHLKRTADEIAVFLKDLLKIHRIKFRNIQDVIIASVVPDVVDEICIFANSYLSKIPSLVQCDSAIEHIKAMLPIEVRTKNPSEVGADRLVNAYAAYLHQQQESAKQESATSQIATIVIDFGTATTFDIIDNNGAYIGGVIAPGIHISLKALAEGARKLPLTSFEFPDKVIGVCTKSALNSGFAFGYKALIEGLLENIIAELETSHNINSPKVILTGGLAKNFKPHLGKYNIELNRNLTINGLTAIYKFNQTLTKQSATCNQQTDK